MGGIIVIIIIIIIVVVIVVLVLVLLLLIISRWTAVINVDTILCNVVFEKGHT